MAASNTFSASFLFQPRHKNILHFVQFFMAITILILGVVRLVSRPASAPRTRTDTMALGMAGKSLGILAYQVLTEHIARLYRFASLKAYLILNTIEIVTWAAVAFMGIQSNVKYCVGTRCALGWVVIVLAVLSSMLATYAAVGSYLVFRYHRAGKTGDQSSSSMYLRETGASRTRGDV